MDDDAGSIRIAPRQGYTIVPNGVLPEGISARAWGVYVYLLSRPPGWVCRPRHLVTVFKEGRDALYKCVNELCELGLLTKEQFFDRGVPRYRYVLPEIPPNPENPNPGNPDPENPDSSHYRDITNTEVSQEKPARPDLFDAFWKAYPKKRDRGHAEKAWPKALSKASAEEIVTAAVEFAVWCKRTGQERKFIAYPATWLNGERWLDELLEDDPPQSNTQGWIALARENAYNETYEGVPELEVGAPWT